jgi:hypothetical protein
MECRGGHPNHIDKVETAMKRLFLLFALALLIEVSVTERAEGTEISTPLSLRTIEGEWVSVNWQRGEVVLLKVNTDGAVLALTRGAKQTEFVFRSKKVIVQEGKVSFVGTDAATRLSLHIFGEGGTVGTDGRMTLTLANAKPGPTFWEDIEISFVKGPSNPALKKY